MKSFNILVYVVIRIFMKVILHVDCLGAFEPLVDWVDDALNNLDLVVLSSYKNVIKSKLVLFFLIFKLNFGVIEKNNGLGDCNVQLLYYIEQKDM